MIMLPNVNQLLLKLPLKDRLVLAMRFCRVEFSCRIVILMLCSTLVAGCGVTFSVDIGPFWSAKRQ